MNTTRTLLFAYMMIGAIVVSCSKRDAKTEMVSKIKTNLNAYLEAQKTAADAGLVIDSIQVKSIDTLTEYKSIELEIGYLANKYDRVYKSAKNREDIVNSAQGLNLDAYIVESYQRDLDEVLQEKRGLEEQYNQLQAKLKTADKKKWKYYQVMAIVYATVNGAAKTIDLSPAMNAAFKVVETPDLIK